MELGEYHWLLGPEATRLLDELPRNNADLSRLAVTLRRQWSANRVHLILEQLELRQRARVKFPFAEVMFFTRRSLEQATDWPLAHYKARRFAPFQPRWDACCGIGGDLLALADQSPCRGTELDPVIGLFAKANCDRLGRKLATVHIGEVETESPRDFAACHLDPDRRAGGQRVTQITDYQPGLIFLRCVLQECPAAAMKLAPAASIPVEWEEACEREWISTRGECRQQVVWSGQLAEEPGTCAATLVNDDDPRPPVVRGRPDLPVPTTPHVGRYVFDPDPSISAARLTGVLAHTHALLALGGPTGYLTGDLPLSDPFAPAFEVLESLPFDQKRVTQLLRQRKIGTLELKQRGTRQPLEKLARQFRSADAEHAVLLLTRLESHVIAILARRCPPNPVA